MKKIAQTFIQVVNDITTELKLNKTALSTRCKTLDMFNKN